LEEYPKSQNEVPVKGILAGTKNRVLEMDIPETGKCNLASS
jgi:hypothetical protein